MPLDVQIIRASEFVRLGARGEFDFESTRAVLIAMADACRKRGIEKALIDVRGASSNLTRSDLAALGKTFSEAAVSRRLRLAILHRKDQGGRAKLFAFFSAMRGRNVRAFEDFEDGLVWLSAQTGGNGQHSATESKVPIRIESQSKKKIPVREGS